MDVSNAEKALREYNFLAWLDDFVQARRASSKLPSKEISNERDNVSVVDETFDDDDDDENSVTQPCGTEEENKSEKINCTASNTVRTFKHIFPVNSAARDNPKRLL